MNADVAGLLDRQAITEVLSLRLFESAVLPRLEAEGLRPQRAAH